jgi:hypothetical protein
LYARQTGRVPAEQVPRPTLHSDLTYFYLTPSIGVGQRLRLETIDRHLERLPLWPTMTLLPQIAFRADATGSDRPSQIEFARYLLPPTIVDQAVGVLTQQPAAVVCSSQAVLNLAIRALVHCADTDGNARADTDSLARELGGLLLGLADHMSRGDPGRDSMALELVRVELFSRINDLSAWYEIADRLFFEILPGMTDDRDFTDVEGVVRAAYGIDLELFWTLTTAYGVAARHDPNSFRVPANFADNPIDPEVLVRWCSAWFVDVDDARALARGDLDARSWWAFSAFFDRPVLRTNAASGVVMRPAFLAMKATPGGMFWPLRNAFVSQGGNHERFSAFFGRGIERLGRGLVEEYLPGTPMLRDEDAIRARWGGKTSPTCDLMLVGGTWVGIDFVYRQFTRETAAIGGFTDLLVDIKRGAIDKLLQIDQTFARGLDTESEQPQALYPMVVVGGPFPMNKLVAEEIVSGLQAEGASVIGVHPDCQPPAIMDLSEFHVLLQVSQVTGAGIAQVLDEWMSSGLNSANFRNWLTTDGPGSQLPGGGAISCRWQQRLERRVLG